MTTSQTLRPHERMKSPSEFRRVFDGRRSVSDQVLVVYGAENGRDYSRLGISVSRKKVRNASDRNRLKRLVREAFQVEQIRAADRRGPDRVAAWNQIAVHGRSEIPDDAGS